MADRYVGFRWSPQRSRVCAPDEDLSGLDSRFWRFGENASVGRPGAIPHNGFHVGLPSE